MRLITSRQGFAVPLLLSLAIAGCGTEQAADTELEELSSEAAALHGASSMAADHFDVSPPLAKIPPRAIYSENEHHAKPLPRPVSGMPYVSDGALQTSAPTAAAPSTSSNFEGIGAGFSGPQGTFSVASAPPDTTGAVGPNHYIQVVNSSFAIFSKTGIVLYGPVATNTLWSGFGGGCQTNNDGDGVVMYDRMADRWIISQFSVSSTPYLQCVAVSQTGDPTGSWYRYSFQYTDFPDYPKMGVWPDAYYISFNMFKGGSTFSGAKVCAYDRAKMLQGQAATQQCFDTGTSYGGLLPATLDSATQPAAGAPDPVIAMGSSASQLAVWRFHVDWTTPSSSTFSGPTTLATASFTEACSGGTCIPQSGTSQQLDSLADRLMYRFAYRRFGDHEAGVVSHAVTAGSSAGMRWYELRGLTSGTPSIYQQGTYAPDSSYRWMGSIAMDQSGNMALGYNVSSSSMYPSIRYTGRLAGDALGQMTQGEGTLLNGGGSQGTNLSRWGDYSTMAIDPSDDCTFWYTTEYLASSGTFNWHTRIGSFKFSSCGGTTTNDFSMSASPTSATVTQGSSATYTISTAVTSGSAQSVSLSASGLPTGASASFAPTSVTAGSSSTMTVATSTSTPAGTYTVTVTGTGASATHTTSVTLTVNGTTPPPSGGITNGDFETGSLSGWTTAGTASVVNNAYDGSYAAQVGSTSPTSGDSSVSQTFTVPSSGTLTFYYNVHCPDSVTYDWATATLEDNTSGTTTTILAKTCTNTNTWKAATASVTGGHSVTLTLVSHDDGYAGDATYVWYDSVSISGGTADTTPPTTSITSPASGATVSGTTTISASASDNVGVTKVELYVDGSLVATDTSSPYSASWNTTSYANGTHTLSSKAYDAAGNVGTSTSVSVSVSNGGSCGTSSQLLANPGFESGNVSWTASSGVIDSSTSAPAHSGSWKAWLDGYGTTHTDTLYQTVTIPSSACSATLSFWVYITTSETTTTTAYDRLTLTVRNSSNTVLATLATYSNLNKTSGYVQKSFDLSAYKGQTIRIYFTGAEDSSAQTSFLLDDAAVNVTQ